MHTEKEERTINGVFQCLDCSISHIRKQDMDFLTKCTLLGWRPYKHGIYVSVPADPDVLIAVLELGFSDSFVKCLNFASILCCSWIQFDVDGAIHDRLDLIEGVDACKPAPLFCRQSRKRYLFFTTPSHGYLVAPVEEVLLKGCKLSSYSVVVGRTVFLEEDLDGPEFGNLMDINTEDIDFIYVTSFKRTNYHALDMDLLSKKIVTEK